MVVLTRKDFQAFCEKHPAALWLLLEAFAERLRHMNEDVLDMSFKDVPYRVLHVLSQLSERHGTSGPAGRTIATPLGVKDVSSMVGSNTDALPMSRTPIIRPAILISL